MILQLIGHRIKFIKQILMQPMQLKGMQFQLPKPQGPNKNSRNGEEVYFEGSKKNEIAQIKAYFKTIVNNSENAYFQKELIKKIISYTTSGIDTSRLYPQMVLASATKDLVEKKLIFFYLSKYSTVNADFARMAVNTFMKDTSSASPHVRALAIRHLSNLRFKGRQQYVMPVLRQGLNDLCAEVKKSSAMGMAKVLTESYRKQQHPERDEELLNTFYGMLRDSDPHVICTILEAINEIQPQGIAMSKKLTHYLVQSLSLFSQLQLPAVVKYIELYDPKTQQQLYQILNVVALKVKSPSLSIVTSISKIFLKYAESYPKLLPDLLERIKASILSFVNHDIPQLQWVALKHIVYLIEYYNTDIFVPQIKKFFIRNQEPSFIKSVKIKLLEINCRNTNLGDILIELCEYLLDEDISKEAANGLELLILKSQDEADVKLIAKSIIKTVQNASSAKDFLCNNVLPAIRNFLRRCPNQLGLLQSVFYRLVNKTTADQARVAIIQIIGDYGDQIQNAIQLLAVSTQSKVSDEVRISILRANLKIFFKRPFQMLNVVNNMFRDLINDDSIHIHVRDYVAYLYRALQNDPEQFRRNFCQRNKNNAQYKSIQAERLQLDTFEVIYGQKEQKWILGQSKGYEIQQIQYAEGLQIEETDQTNQGDALDLTIDESGNIKKREVQVNLDSKYHQLQAEDFDLEFEMSANEYEVCWENYQIGSSITRMIRNMDLLTEQMLEELFKLWNISTIASAEDEESIKLYLYCKLVQGEIACMEFQVLKEADTMTLLIKSQNEQLGGFVSRYIEDFLKINQIL